MVSPVRSIRAAVAIAIVAFVPLAEAGRYAKSGHGSPATGVFRIPHKYGRGQCGHCHGAHSKDQRGRAARTYRYGLFALEEQVCWACHDGSTTYAADAKSPISLTPANSSTDIYKHPVSNMHGGRTPSPHRAKEKHPTAFASGNRHVECSDCHDAHVAQNNGTPGVSTHRPDGQDGHRLTGALLGATGIVVSSWQGAGQPLTAASYKLEPLLSRMRHREWQICFKCHSSYTTLPRYQVGSGPHFASKLTQRLPGQVLAYRDAGQAFNPNNHSYHPVTAVGKNQRIPAASFVSPWSARSIMVCSDCHSRPESMAGGNGPHGSTYAHILDRPLTLKPVVGQRRFDLCVKCHRRQTYVSGTDPASNTNYRDGRQNLHALHVKDAATCYTCHDSHGANNPYLLNFDRGIVDPIAGTRLTSYEYWQPYPPNAPAAGARGGTCQLACHRKNHASRTYLR